MKCYYEELGVPRDANDADIKTAYRKLALRWHPDKNLDKLDEAKERFQLIQQAYEVLSDAHERSWYDNHRDQILRGKNSDYEDNCLDLFQYFTSSCFKGYGDDERGFYATYSEVFATLAAEDTEFMDDPEQIAAIPKFGDSQSSYDDLVGPFYAYWSAYCTKRTYAWLCPYNIQEIKDRRVLREIEKEMKKVVQKAKRERNEEVRNLVSFIRKRDRRVQAYKRLLEERAELNRQKQEQNRLEQIRKRQREVAEMRQTASQAHNEAYEEQLRQLEQHYGSDSDDDDDDAEEDDEDDDADEEEEKADGEGDGHELDDLYCIVCNKAFRNVGAFINHESSKKHRDAAARLVQEMQVEEAAYAATPSPDKTPTDGSDSALNEELDEAEEEDEDEEEEETPLPAAQKSGKKNKKKRQARKAAAALELSDDSAQEDDDEGEEDATQKGKEKAEDLTTPVAPQKQGKKGKKARRGKKSNLTDSSADEKDDGDARAVDELLARTKLGGDGSSDSADAANWSSNKKGATARKQKANRTPKTAAKQKPKPTTETAAEAEASPVPVPAAAATATAPPLTSLAAALAATPSSSDINTIHACVTCHATFPSKNKLFVHLKLTGHGVYLPKGKAAAASGLGAAQNGVGGGGAGSKQARSKAKQKRK